MTTLAAPALAPPDPGASHLHVRVLLRIVGLALTHLSRPRSHATLVILAVL